MITNKLQRPATAHGPHLVVLVHRQVLQDVVLDGGHVAHPDPVLGDDPVLCGLPGHALPGNAAKVRIHIGKRHQEVRIVALQAGV
jgi:hypothetical protein